MTMTSQLINHCLVTCKYEQFFGDYIKAAELGLYRFSKDCRQGELSQAMSVSVNNHLQMHEALHYVVLAPEFLEILGSPLRTTS